MLSTARESATEKTSHRAASQTDKGDAGNHLELGVGDCRGARVKGARLARRDEETVTEGRIFF